MLTERLDRGLRFQHQQRHPARPTYITRRASLFFALVNTIGPRGHQPPNGTLASCSPLRAGRAPPTGHLEARGANPNGSAGERPAPRLSFSRIFVPLYLFNNEERAHIRHASRGLALATPGRVSPSVVDNRQSHTDKPALRLDRVRWPPTPKRPVGRAVASARDTLNVAGAQHRIARIQFNWIQFNWIGL